jgi:hypothetical protein
MSKTTLRKRIALTATTALFAGMLSVIALPSAQATHPAADATNGEAALGVVAGNSASTGQAGSMFVATTTNNTSAAVAAIPSTGIADCTGLNDVARSKGLLYKDSSSGVAQSATVLAGGALTLYSCSATAVAFVATAGSFAPQGGATLASAWTYNASNSRAWSANITTAGGTGVAAIWSAPTTAGTYTVSLYTGFYTNSAGASVIATATNAALPATLSANITVSVVAASAGGTYSSGDSVCQAVRGTTQAPASNVDDTGTNADGVDWSIDLALKDGYGAALPTGALIATATNNAKIAFGTAGATPVAGTASTITTSSAGSASTVRVSQATAGVPITTTVTVTYNGVTVCSKTVSIAGTVAAITIPAANIAVQDLGASTGNAKWFTGEARVGTFYVVATDSVGNRLATPATLGSYSVDSATLGTTVTDVTVPSLASSTSSSSVLSASVGKHACAATAGTQKGIKLKFTLANGTVITSAPFDLACADDPATVTASFDKAKYISGEIATLTVAFKDTKGNVANNITALGASSISVPGMTLVSATGAADIVAKAGGKVTYTYTVGQSAGKFAAVVDFTGGGTNATLAQYATVQNPSYEISSGGDTTTNADVLKSIVALIASINKQIQALQKLILKR